jgi:hypothetical protein
MRQQTFHRELKTFNQLAGLRTEEVILAASDYLFTSATGVKSYAPGADIFAYGEATIAEIAATMNRARGTKALDDSRQGHISAALVTGDLQATLAAMFNKLIRDSNQHGIANLLKWTAPATVKDFRPSNFGDVEIDGLGELFAAGEPKQAVLSHSGEQVEIKTFAALLTVTRQALISNDLELLKHGVAKFSRAAARVEKSLAYSLFSDNPNLADGSPLFVADNTISGGTGTSVSVANVGAAFAALARQNDLAGDDIDASAKFILAPPEIATEAAYSVNQIGAQCEVISAAGLPDGAWYALADPNEYPVIGRVSFGDNALQIHGFRNNKNFSIDGAAMKALLDVNYTPLGRTGAVRVNQS